MSEPTNPVNPQPSAPQDTTTAPAAPVEDKAQLVERARIFLELPQIRYQDIPTKRRFLLEKGLADGDIDQLLREKPFVPIIPPRAYPQPAQSNLPNLLIGLARLFSWLIGGSAFLLFIYNRLLLPRIHQTFIARHNLKVHQLNAFKKFNQSLKTFKDSQAETFALLPPTQRYTEPSPFASCHSLEEISSASEAHPGDVPTISLLRCALADFQKENAGKQEHPTTQELFELLQKKVPALQHEGGQQFQESLWSTLSTASIFTTTPHGSDEVSTSEPPRWHYVPPQDPEPSHVMKSLKTLHASIPRDSRSKDISQHTLQTLSEFTGYISSQLYAPTRYTSSILPQGPRPSSVEDELKKEIRALKGAVLNRRSFMPTISRTTSST